MNGLPRYRAFSPIAASLTLMAWQAAPSSNNATASRFWRRDGRESFAGSPDCEHNPKLSLLRVTSRTAPSRVSGGNRGMTVSQAAIDHRVVTPVRSGRVIAAVADLREGLYQSWLWTTLAHQDLKLRYRGSILGPFWQTITTVVMIGAMGFIYAKLFNTPMQTYFPLLSAGLVFWQFISGMIIEGCGTFFSQQGIIQQVRLPFSLHAYRLVYR